jgi:hypothetical protein
VLGVVLGGCITPSIPIPPPEPTAMEFTVTPAEGIARFSYDAMPRFGFATVYVFNETVGRGVIDTARSDGSVGPTAPFPANLGDNIIVTFDVGDESVATCVVLREGTPNERCNPF